MLSLIFAAAVFLLPGLAFSLIKSEIPLHERLCAAAGLSISLNILGVFVLNHFLNIPVNLSIIVFYALFISVFFFLIYCIRERKELQEKFTGFNFNIHEKINEAKKDKIKNFKFIILIAALIFIFNLHYGVHSDYDFPYHTDEWQHIARAVQIMDNSNIPDVDPYFNKYSVGTMDLEIGFHIFLAEFFILSNKDPILFYKFLPAIFVILSSLMLFILVKKITNNFYAGIFSMLFFASLKSAITILGVWFFVPLSMCFMLIFLFFYLFMEGMRKNSASYFLFAAVTISGIALIHPQSASWIYPVIILYLLAFALRNLLKINIRNILIFKNLIIGNLMLFFLPFLSFIYFFKILWKDNLETTLTYFVTEFIVFRGCPEERSVCEPEFILNFYGEAAMILAGIGIIYLLYKFMKNKDDDKFKIPVLLSWIAAAAFLISLLHVESTGKLVAYLMGIDYSPFTLLTGYIRIIYEALLCLTALSGIGVYAVLRFIQNIIYKFNFPPNPYKLTTKNLAFAALSIIIVILVFNSIFTGYYDPKQKLYKGIDTDDYKAIKWIEENYGNYNVVFARPHISETIYPISRNYVVSITPHAGIPTTDDRVWYTNSFFMGDCKTKGQILDKYEVDYVLVKYKIKCDFLSEIYHEKRYVYKFEGKN